MVLNIYKYLPSLQAFCITFFSTRPYSSVAFHPSQTTVDLVNLPPIYPPKLLATTRLLCSYIHPLQLISILAIHALEARTIHPICLGDPGL